MQDISFVVDPTAEHAFFEKTQFERLLRDHLFEVLGLPAQFLHLVTVCGPRGVPSQTLLPGFHEVLRPLVINALGYPLSATQLGNAVLTTQAIQNDPDLLFR